jgi:hypothetical protein
VFSPRYLDGHDATAADLRTKYGSQFVLNTSHTTGPQTEAWHAAIGSADSHHYDVAMNYTSPNYAVLLANKVREIFPAMIGVNKPWADIQPVDLVPLVAPLNIQALLLHAV